MGPVFSLVMRLHNFLLQEVSSQTPDVDDRRFRNFSIFVYLFIYFGSRRKEGRRVQQLNKNSAKEAGWSTSLPVPMIMTSVSAGALLPLFSGKKALDPGSDI